MADSNTQIRISILDKQDYYQPGQQINGNVTINTASGKSLTFAALRLIWTGRIVAQLAGQFDRKEYFTQVFHLDPNNDTFVKSADLSSSAPSALLQVDGQITFPFQVTLPSDRLLPSSFEINDTMMGALSNVEYMLEASLDHQTFDPMPIKVRTAILVMTAPSSASESITPSTHQQQQQISEKSYLSTVLQDRAEYRAAARITVPCKTSPRGAIIPVVVHIWHDCQYSRRNGISLSLVRMCKIHCGERTEILTKNLSMVTRDLELSSRTDYSVQTLSETLQIPNDTVPSITSDQGELASIEYKVTLAVHAHPGALYTELPSTSTTTAMQYMLVECPLYIDTTTQQQVIFNNNKSAQQLSLPGATTYLGLNKIIRGETSRSVSSNITAPSKDNKKMTSRMKGMFRRRSKLEPTNGVPVFNNSNGNNASSASLSNKNYKDKDSTRGSSSLRQVMSSLRPRNNSNSNIAAAITTTSVPFTVASNGNSSVTTKPQSCGSSINSNQIQSTPLRTSPTQSVNSSITDLSKIQNPVRPTTPHSPPPPPSAIFASNTTETTSTEDISKPSSPPYSLPATSSPTSTIPPPPSYSESGGAPLSKPSPTTIQSPSSPLPPTITRSKSIHERALPTINSAPKPLVQEEQPHEPIPGLDGGGVHYFDMFPDSDEEDETHNTSTTKNMSSHVSEMALLASTGSTQTGTIGGRDDQTEITTTTLDSSNQPRYFNLFPDDDLTDEEDATKQQAVRENLRSVYPDADNKLDEVNVSDSEPDSDSEEETDLISMMARRERRIERARRRKN